MRILVVDDNTVNLATLEKGLKDKYEVIPMLSGRRAIRYLYCEKVDLILLDVQMPVMDGIQTLKEIRTQENGVTVPVIFLTANKDKDTVIEGSKLGIMDYVTKPFDVEDLESRIDRVFKRLGILPMETEELFKYLEDILEDIEERNMKQAIAKMDEILCYQVEEDISGRIRNARIKLENENVQAAENMVRRILNMLAGQMGTDSESNGMTISNRKLMIKLLYILEDIETFKTQEAVEKCKELKKFLLPEEITSGIQQAISFLMEYDDEKAGYIIKKLFARMKAI